MASAVSTRMPTLGSIPSSTKVVALIALGAVLANGRSGGMGVRHGKRVQLRASNPSPPTCRWHTRKPFFWIHVPKTGSAFHNSLVHAGCPAVVGMDAVLSVDPLIRAIRENECGANFSRFGGSHPPLPVGTPERFEGTTLVMLLRNPVRRLVSGFFHGLHDCDRMREAFGITQAMNCSERGNRCYDFYQSYTDAHVRDYAECVAGCATNMLTGSRCGSGRPNRTTVNRALAQLEGFDFLGITDRWEDTVSAWSAFARQPVAESHLVALRQGSYTRNDLRRVGRIFSSMYLPDQPLYELADRRLSMFLEQCTAADSDNGNTLRSAAHSGFG